MVEKWSGSGFKVKKRDVEVLDVCRRSFTDIISYVFLSTPFEQIKGCFYRRLLLTTASSHTGLNIRFRPHRMAC
jgi:hypothetical protein